MTDVVSPLYPLPEAYNWTLAEQVINRGFTFEEHKAITEDGFILTLYRVPGRLGDSTTGKQPVYMQHGLIDDGGTWFFSDETLDLSLELVDKGYDIWVTNSRGTAFSNEHVNYTVKD